MKINVLQYLGQTFRGKDLISHESIEKPTLESFYNTNPKLKLSPN